MLVLINYSDKNFTNAQKLNSESARSIGGFDKVINYSPKDIDIEFYTKNQKILSNPKGGGYWLWKPYFIRKTLDLLEDGDILFYCDSGTVFKQKVNPLVELIDKYNQDIIIFELQFQEKQYTKRDAFILLDCDSSKFSETKQRMATYLIIKKSSFSINFFNEYLRYASDERLITDRLNTMGKSNYPEFVSHRHDQSILSLLSKKYNLEAFRDPSQWGEPVRDLYKNSDYPVIIQSTRKANKNFRFFFNKIKKHILKIE